MKVVGSRALGAIVVALIGALVALGIFEIWALASGNRPITGYVQTFIVTYGGFVAVGLYLIGVVTGTLIYHFWDHPADWNKGEGNK